MRSETNGLTYQEMIFFAAVNSRSIQCITGYFVAVVDFKDIDCNSKRANFAAYFQICV